MAACNTNAHCYRMPPRGEQLRRIVVTTLVAVACSKRGDVPPVPAIAVTPTDTSASPTVVDELAVFALDFFGDEPLLIDTGGSVYFADSSRAPGAGKGPALRRLSDRRKRVR